MRSHDTEREAANAYWQTLATPQEKQTGEGRNGQAGREFRTAGVGAPQRCAYRAAALMMGPIPLLNRKANHPSVAAEEE
jgi:hypothetical protein